MGDFLGATGVAGAGLAAGLLADLASGLGVGLASGVAAALVALAGAAIRALLQRFFCAAAIFLRAAALRMRRLGDAGSWARADASSVEVALDGRPGLRLMLRGEMLPRIAFASCRRAIS